jgi:hypothetical protein
LHGGGSGELVVPDVVPTGPAMNCQKASIRLRASLSYSVYEMAPTRATGRRTTAVTAPTMSPSSVSLARNVRSREQPSVDSSTNKSKSRPRPIRAVNEAPWTRYGPVFERWKPCRLHQSQALVQISSRRAPRTNRTSRFSNARSRKEAENHQAFEHSSATARFLRTREVRVEPQRAWVAKLGQRRRAQDPVPQGFAGSNPAPRILCCGRVQNRLVISEGCLRRLRRGTSLGSPARRVGAVQRTSRSLNVTFFRNNQLPQAGGAAWVRAPRRREFCA